MLNGWWWWWWWTKRAHDYTNTNIYIKCFDDSARTCECASEQTVIYFVCSQKQKATSKFNIYFDVAKIVSAFVWHKIENLFALLLLIGLVYVWRWYSTANKPTSQQASKPAWKVNITKQKFYVSGLVNDLMLPLLFHALSHFNLNLHPLFDFTFTTVIFTFCWSKPNSVKYV